MKDAERDAAVEKHLADLDDEIARLRRMEAALDRRLDAWDQDRGARPPEPDAGEDQ